MAENAGSQNPDLAGFGLEDDVQSLVYGEGLPGDFPKDEGDQASGSGEGSDADLDAPDEGEGTSDDGKGTGDTDKIEVDPDASEEMKALQKKASDFMSQRDKKENENQELRDTVSLLYSEMKNLKTAGASGAGASDNGAKDIKLSGDANDVATIGDIQALLANAVAGAKGQAGAPASDASFNDQVKASAAKVTGVKDIIDFATTAMKTDTYLQALPDVASQLLHAAVKWKEAEVKKAADAAFKAGQEKQRKLSKRRGQDAETMPNTGSSTARGRGPSGGPRGADKYAGMSPAERKLRTSMDRFGIAN